MKGGELSEVGVEFKGKMRGAIGAVLRESSRSIVSDGEGLGDMLKQEVVTGKLS